MGGRRQCAGDLGRDDFNRQLIALSQIGSPEETGNGSFTMSTGVRTPLQASGPRPLQLSSPDAAAWKRCVQHFAVGEQPRGPLPGKGTSARLPWGCAAAASGLESWAGLVPNACKGDVLKPVHIIKNPDCSLCRQDSQAETGAIGLGP